MAGVNVFDHLMHNTQRKNKNKNKTKKKSKTTKKSKKKSQHKQKENIIQSETRFTVGPNGDIVEVHELTSDQQLLLQLSQQQPQSQSQSQSQRNRVAKTIIRFDDDEDDNNVTSARKKRKLNTDKQQFINQNEQ